MSAPLSDDAARARISRHGLGETLFVEAGAGTGKTRQLVERITQLVLHDGIPLGRIAAITFTEAAAAELHDRIRTAFEQTSATTTDETIRARCVAALAEADLAAISTLHGFARRLLSEHPVAAQLPPRVEVRDEVSSLLAAEERWERFVDRLYDDPTHEELLVRAALVEVPLEAAYPGQATMKEVADALTQNWDLLETAPSDAPGPLPPLDLSRFDEAVAHLARRVDDCDDPTDNFYRHCTEALLPSMLGITRISDPHQKLRALKGAPKWGRGRGGKDPAWQGDVKAAKDLVDAVNEAREEVTSTVADQVLRRLLVVTVDEVLRAAAERRDSGELEFHDLLVLARRLLRTSPAARRALHQRYTHLLLDEFQDTDPLQIEIAVLIGSSDETAPSWHEATVEPGRLFFVGDPKQSIYRFRRADIGLFLSARDRFGGDGQLVALETNFRTVAPILEWVNAAFGELMAEEKPGSQPQYRELHPHRPPSGDADHRPRLLGGPHEGLRAAELREQEAASVASTIADIRERPEAWPVEGDDGWRPATLADVAILLPTRTSLGYLRDALDHHGIPYRLDTGTLVYDTQEVRDLLSVVRVVDDPTDQLSLVAALRSPLYACSDVDLFTYHHAGARWDLRSDPPEGVAADHPVVSALAHLRTLWEERWWTSPSELLRRVVDDRQAFLLAFAQHRPEDVWRRLRFVLDQARAFEAAAGGGLRDFIAWADLQRSGSAGVHEPLLPETDRSAVRIMTIHGAKGLEFPITVLSGMTTRPSGGRNGVSLRWDDDGRPEVSIKKGIATSGHDPRADLEAEMDVDEKLRLLYVACTRGRDHLVVATHHCPGDGSYAQQLHSLMAEHPATNRDEPLEHPLPEALATEPIPPTESEAERDSWIAARSALLDAQRRARFVSATTLAAEAQAGGAAAADHDPDAFQEHRDDVTAGDADPPEVPSPGILVQRRRGRAGTAIGRAVHATLQFLDLAAPAGIDEQAAHQAELEDVAEHAGTVADMVRAGLDAPTIRRASEVPHHREVYVAAPVGERVVEGYVDLLLRTPEGLVIVDYKTDTVRSEADVDAKLAVYELQGAAYAVALEASTGTRVAECRFVFCKPGGAIERAVADLPAAMQRVRDLAS